MLGDSLSKNPINPMNEGDKDKTQEEKPEDSKILGPTGSKIKKKKDSHEEQKEDELETSYDEMSYLEWKERRKKKKLQSKKKKSITKIMIESSDDSDTDYTRRPSRSSNKGSSSKEKGKIGYHRVSHDYIFQIPSYHSASIHMGKTLILMGRGIINGRQKYLVI
jgi:hypothetical protein